MLCTNHRYLFLNGQICRPSIHGNLIDTIGLVKFSNVFLALIDYVSRSDWLCQQTPWIQAIQSKDLTNPLILQLLEQHHLLSTVSAKIIHFCWISSHVGIKGNDLADQAAKYAFNDDPSSLPVLYTDRRRHINSFVRSKCKPSGMWLLTINFMPFSLLWAAGLEVGVSLAERK